MEENKLSLACHAWHRGHTQKYAKGATNYNDDDDHKFHWQKYTQCKNITIYHIEMSPPHPLIQLQT